MSEQVQPLLIRIFQAPPLSGYPGSGKHGHPDSMLVLTLWWNVSLVAGLLVALNITLLFCYLVQRVHWLRARSQRNRWSEELILVGYEMVWTARYFWNRADLWRSRVVEPNAALGLKAYATCQAAQWSSLAVDAERLFSGVNPDYK